MNSNGPANNLFVIAPMRSGSTSMFHFLAGHSAICPSPIKEPNYFVDDLPESYFEEPRGFDLQRYLNKAVLPPLHIARLTEVDQYRKLKGSCEAASYFLEASTAYWLRPESTKKIHSYDSGSRIILLVRDPHKRCYSHYSMERGLGREQRTFEQAMADEIDAYRSGRLEAFSYLGLSLYDKTIQRYRALFDHVLVVRLEDITHKPEVTTQRIFEFLSLDVPTDLEFLHLNQTRKVYHSKLYNWFIGLGIKDRIRPLLGSGLRRSLFRAISRVNPPFTGEMAQQELLMDIFQRGSKQYYSLNEDAQSLESF